MGSILFRPSSGFQPSPERFCQADWTDRMPRTGARSGLVLCGQCAKGNSQQWFLSIFYFSVWSIFFPFVFPFSVWFPFLPLVFLFSFLFPFNPPQKGSPQTYAQPFGNAVVSSGCVVVRLPVGETASEFGKWQDSWPERGLVALT